MKKITVIGSTGSIGVNTLQVARHLGYPVLGLAAHSNIDLLEQQANEFQPEIIAVYDKSKALELQKRLPQFTVIGGLEGLNAVSTLSSADMVISAMTGTLGLVPTLSAIKAKKDVGLANKEALVSGGALVMELAKHHNINLIPIDSEHSAIFQCLQGQKKEAIDRLILTASGGPFRSYSMEQLKAVTVEQALQHPTWKMGPKITIDCSTLMNKGLEVIEAHWLFSIPIDRIEVVIHPQSVVHSMVEFVDQSSLAQLGVTDMRIPIQYALTYPDRKPGILPRFDWTKMHQLQFYSPDREKFRCLDLAYQSIKQGDSMPGYMNAANEILVNRYLKKEIGWMDIGRKLEDLMLKHNPCVIHNIEDVLSVDALARREAFHV
jgi:1-deoxy-D-xylulose-5-phosphate reductoisomerase